MKENKLYKVCKVIYTFLLKIIFRPRVYGKENIPKQGPIIFAGNHRHAADPIMVMSSTKRQVHYMAKEFLFKGLHGILFKKIGTIKISNDKGNPLAVMEAMRVLKQGGAVGIFPEGTRNRTNQELLKFRQGTVVIAKNTNALIVPFAIRGKYKVFQKSVVLEYGEPIDISKMETEEANEYLKDKVLQLLRK